MPSSVKRMPADSKGAGSSAEAICAGETVVEGRIWFTNSRFCWLHCWLSDWYLSSHSAFSVCKAARLAFSWAISSVAFAWKVLRVSFSAVACSALSFH